MEIKRTNEERIIVAAAFFGMAFLYLMNFIIEIKMGKGIHVMSVIMTILSIGGPVLIGIDQLMTSSKIPFAGIGFALMALAAVNPVINYTRQLVEGLRWFGFIPFIIFGLVVSCLNLLVPVCAAVIMFFAKMNHDSVKSLVRILYPALLFTLIVSTIMSEIQYAIYLYSYAYESIRYSAYSEMRVYLMVQVVLLMFRAILQVFFIPSVIPDELKYKKSITRADGTVIYLQNTGYFNLGLHVVLLIITCNLWLLKWSYHATKYSNGVSCMPNRNLILTWVLYVFVPFYPIYWNYVTAQRIDMKAKERGVESDTALICLVLTLLGLVYIPPIIMQEKLNAIVIRGTQPGQTSDNAQQDYNI